MKQPPESKTPESDGIQKKIFAILKGLSDVEDIPAILHAVSLEMDDARSLELRLNEALAKLAEATKDKEKVIQWLESCRHNHGHVDQVRFDLQKWQSVEVVIDAAMKANNSPHHNAN